MDPDAFHPVRWTADATGGGRCKQRGVGPAILRAGDAVERLRNGARTVRPIGRNYSATPVSGWIRSVGQRRDGLSLLRFTRSGEYSDSLRDSTRIHYLDGWQSLHQRQLHASNCCGRAGNLHDQRICVCSVFERRAWVNHHAVHYRRWPGHSDTGGRSVTRFGNSDVAAAPI